MAPAAASPSPPTPPSNPVVANFVHHVWMMDVTEFKTLFGARPLYFAAGEGIEYRGADKRRIHQDWIARSGAHLGFVTLLILDRLSVRFATLGPATDRTSTSSLSRNCARRQ